MRKILGLAALLGLFQPALAQSEGAALVLNYTEGELRNLVDSVWDQMGVTESDSSFHDFSSFLEQVALSSDYPNVALRAVQKYAGYCTNPNTKRFELCMSFFGGSTRRQSYVVSSLGRIAQKTDNPAIFGEAVSTLIGALRLTRGGNGSYHTRTGYVSFADPAILAAIQLQEIYTGLLIKLQSDPEDAPHYVRDMNRIMQALDGTKQQDTVSEIRAAAEKAENEIIQQLNIYATQTGGPILAVLERPGGTPVVARPK
ncbi:MAG: hypothetical protein HY402_04240 [Elusimicrobia bacterium]|nr:hypothetical protein [Elusimicrobiota bacterium]